MVAHLVRLKLTLLRNIFRRSRAQAIGAILGILYFGLLVVLLGGGVAALRSNLDVASIALPLAGAALLLAWALVPLLAFGSDPTLDAARFATFAVPYRQLAAGLVLAGLVGLPAIATSVLVGATVVTWSHSLLSGAVAVVSAVVGVLTCVTLSRLLSALVSGYVTSRRGRDVTALIGLAAVVLVGPLIAFVANAGEQMPDRIDLLSTVAGWSPLGWVWAAPADVATGHVWTGLVRLALAVGLLACLGALWARALPREVENPRGVARAEAVHAAGDLGVFARVPDTRTGAVAGQVLTYYRRDPRFQAGLLMTPLLPLALLIPYFTTDADWVVLLMGPLVAYLLGWAEHNGVAFDSSAFWLHVASGTPGRADRLGRLAVNAVLAVVLVPVYCVVGVAVGDRWDLLPVVAGVSLAFLGAGYGITFVQSVVLPYPVPEPGESPFSSPPGAAGITALSQTVASIGTAILTAPTLLLAWLAWSGDDWAVWATAASGLLLGGGLFVLGLRVGSRVYERRAPELLQSLTRS